MNHLYDEDDGYMYFNSGKTGHKIDALKLCDKVSYCVYDGGQPGDIEWALNIRSVIVFGRIHFVEDKGRAMDIARKLSRKFTDDETYIESEIEKFGANTLVMELIPEHICGKIVNEA